MFLPFFPTHVHLRIHSRVHTHPHTYAHTVLLLRYADNFDNVNNAYVIVQKSDKANIEAYGSPEEFIGSFGYLLGKQAFSGG